MSDEAPARFSDDERTTAQGLFTVAEAYLDAAEHLRDAPTRPHSEMPIRFLLYHAAELYLKAHLRSAGMSVRKVKKKAHQFTGLIEAAKEKGLEIPIFAADILKFGQQTDDVMGSRYISTGFRQWFELPDLQAAVQAVRKAVVAHPDRPQHIMLWGGEPDAN